jgi:hypothetical protein
MKASSVSGFFLLFFTFFIMETDFKNTQWDSESHHSNQKGLLGYSAISNTDQSQVRLRFFKEAGEGNRLYAPSEALLRWAISEVSRVYRLHVHELIRLDEESTVYLLASSSDSKAIQPY